VMANDKERMTQYEVQLSTVMVEHKHPHCCEGYNHDQVEKETLVIRVLLTRENCKSAKCSLKKI
jgi:hypothetical protein